MITFLFWNIFRKHLQESIHRIVNAYNVDVIILAECTVEAAHVLQTLNKDLSNFHFAPSPGCTKIQFFTKFPVEYIPVIVEEDRVTIRRLQIDGMSQEILVAALHFPSKTYWSSSDQLAESQRYADLINKAEEEVGHQRTIVVGDFNMDPYEGGMVSARGFNAVMSKAIAQRRKRIVQKQEYSFFYNPMWGLAGDISAGPMGTYYLNPPGHSSYYWHTLDQLLIRPDMLESFNPSMLKILDSDGERSLLSPNGIPDKSWGSDHLPVLFQFDF